jgi:hypothetical protein
MYRTMMLLHAKEELDAPPGGETEHFDKAMHKVVEHVELAYSNGDHELGECGSFPQGLRPSKSFCQTAVPVTVASDGFWSERRAEIEDHCKRL